MPGDEPPRSRPTAQPSDEVIRIADLAPREDVKGGRKIVLGENPSSTEKPPS